MFEKYIADAKNNPKAIQDHCETQRTSRNENSKQQLLSQDFKGMRTDEILIGLLNKSGHLDPRNNLCIWARPTNSVVNMIAEVQKELLALAPRIWITPLSCLHMTVLEIIHSETPDAVAFCTTKLQPCLKKLANYTLEHRTRLIRPKLSFDDAAVALTFVPAAGEHGHDVNDEAFTYIHLRDDLSRICHQNGVEVAARYSTTSSHITMARFITDQDHKDKSTIVSWISKLESLNLWLQDQYWPKKGQLCQANTCWEWYVGAERGLEIRKGTLWYGGGESIEIGLHF